MFLSLCTEQFTWRVITSFLVVPGPQCSLCTDVSKMCSRQVMHVLGIELAYSVA